MVVEPFTIEHIHSDLGELKECLSRGDERTKDVAQNILTKYDYHSHFDIFCRATDLFEPELLALLLTDSYGLLDGATLIQLLQYFVMTRTSPHNTSIPFQGQITLHHSSYSVQHLSTYSEKVESCVPVFLSTCGYKTILRVMDDSQTSSQVIIGSAITLALVARDAKLRQFILAGDTIDLLIECFKSNMTSPESLVALLILVTNLSYSSIGQDHMLKSLDIVDMTLEALTTHKEQKVQIACLYVLRNLTYHVKMGKLQEEGKITLLDDIINVIHENTSNPSIQLHGWWILGNLLNCSQRNVISFISKKGIETMLDLINAHHDIHIVEAISFLVMHIAKLREHHPHLAKLNVIDSLLTTIALHSSQPEYLTYSIKALHLLAFDPSTLSSISQHHLFPTLISLLNHPHQCEKFDSNLARLIIGFCHNKTMLATMQSFQLFKSIEHLKTLYHDNLSLLGLFLQIQDLLQIPVGTLGETLQTHTKPLDTSIPSEEQSPTPSSNQPFHPEFPDQFLTKLDQINQLADNILLSDGFTMNSYHKHADPPILDHNTHLDINNTPYHIISDGTHPTEPLSIQIPIHSSTATSNYPVESTEGTTTLQPIASVEDLSNPSIATGHSYNDTSTLSNPIQTSPIDLTNTGTTSISQQPHSHSNSHTTHLRKPFDHSITPTTSITHSLDPEPTTWSYYAIPLIIAIIAVLLVFKS